MSYTVEINVFSVWTLRLHVRVIKKTQNSLSLEHPDLIAKSIGRAASTTKKFDRAAGVYTYWQSCPKSTHITFERQNAIDGHCSKSCSRKWPA